MRRWLIRVSVIFFVLIAMVVIAGWIASEPRPTGTPGAEADALARRIEAAIDKPAWDATRAVWWNFGDRYVHLWDRDRNFSRVRWGDNEVLLDLGTQKGIARRNGQQLEGTEADDLVRKAYERFLNDSFWLNPLAKLFDEGTERSIVKREDGSEALLIAYRSGGATPGDAYLWILGKDDLPTAWKMWADILPIGGLEVSWEKWIELPNGARISTRHAGLVSFEIENVVGAPSVTAVEAEDPFLPLLAKR